VGTSQLNHNEYSSTLTYDLTDSYPNITSTKNNTILSSYLQLNGVDRSIPYDSIYYNYVIPYEHKLSSCNDGINIYSFSLNPNDLQPSGSYNILKNLQDDYSTKKTIYENSLNNNYNFSWINTLGWNIVSKVELEIGGFVIDRSYNQYLFIWNQLFNTNFKKLDFNKLFSLSSSAYTYDNTTKNSFDIYIPIKLFFNKY
jgi:hypothetical protein